MKRLQALALVFLAAIGIPGVAQAIPVFDFVLTSTSGPTVSVTGSIQFNGDGYSWSDVTDASLKVNGQETLSFYVGGFPCGPDICQPGCNPEIYCQRLLFDFSPSGKYATGGINDDGEFTTLMLGGSGLNWSGTFVTDNQSSGCGFDNNPCLFTGYWQYTEVPEPASEAILIGGLAAIVFSRRRRKTTTPASVKCA